MDPVEIVAVVLGALNDAQIPYMLVGSLSSNLYGEPRFTKDADFVVQLTGQSLEALAQRLGPAFKLDRQMGFETITGRSCYRIAHAGGDFLIELFELTDDPHNQERFARRRTSVFAGVRVFVPTAEDVIVQKLRWYQRGQRLKDLLDVQSVIDVQAGNLDMAYLRHWCGSHGTLELLEKAFREGLDKGNQGR